MVDMVVAVAEIVMAALVHMAGAVVAEMEVLLTAAAMVVAYAVIVEVVAAAAKQ